MDFNKIKNFKLSNFFTKDSDDMIDEPTRYKLIDIDNPNGWNFNELDTLGEMGFKIDGDYEMVCEIEISNLETVDEKIPIKVYKNEDGYVLETSRRYVFETFNKMIEFIDSCPTDQKKLK